MKPIRLIRSCFGIGLRPHQIKCARDKNKRDEFASIMQTSPPDLAWAEIFMHSPTAICVCNKDGLIMQKNSAFESMMHVQTSSNNVYDLLFGNSLNVNAILAAKALESEGKSCKLTIKHNHLRKINDSDDVSGVKVALESAKSTVVHNFISKSAHSITKQIAPGYINIHMRLMKNNLIVVTVTNVTVSIGMQKKLVKFADRQSKLLTAMFPIHVIDKLMSGCDMGSIATLHDNVCILFADVVGFTQMCSCVSPREVMNFLNQLFCTFDNYAAEYKIYKLETIGDCYVAVTGLVQQKNSFVECIHNNNHNVDDNVGDDDGDDDGDDYNHNDSSKHLVNIKYHAQQMLDFATAIVNAAYSIRMPHTGKPTEVRVGIHCGPVVSGIVGLKMPRYCLFGDAINMASRMETTCPVGYIQMTQDFYDELSFTQGIETYGPINVKGKGEMYTYRKKIKPSISEILNRGVVLDEEYKKWMELLIRKPTTAEDSMSDNILGYNYTISLPISPSADQYLRDL
jgi:class 3 adenylate cyclase